MKRRAPRREPLGGSRLEFIRQALARGWRPPIAHLVGFRLTEIKKGSAKVELQASLVHENPMGTLHGGVICDIADAAMGMAYASLLRTDESFTTVELKVNFLRPFWRGRLVAKGKLIRKGRTMGLMECRVTDDRRRLVAYATSTCMTLSGDQARGLTRARQESP